MLIVIGVTSSCVNDDSFFPEEPEGELNLSVSLVSYVDYLNKVELSEERLCFNFVYPISLGLTANDARVRIDNYSALLSTIASQSLNFNIHSIEFPFQIQFIGSDQPITINNEQDFKNVLGDCQISLFRNDFDRYFNECFKLDYPVTVISENTIEVEITTDDQWYQFLLSQSESYQPVFKFPISIFRLADERVVEVNSYYGFYNVFQECLGACPALAFSIENTDQSNLSYRFISEYSIEFTGSYAWFVDDQFIEGDGPAVQGDDVLEYTFATPGTYQVCIQTETPDCPQGILFCKEVVVDVFCPQPFYEFTVEAGTTNYIFNAAFDGIEDLSYDWTINEQVVETDGGIEGDNILFRDLAPGDYTVCIKIITESCPQGTAYCREVFVAPICPELFFIQEQEGDTSSYNFFADFESMNVIVYSWAINGEFIELDGGANGDNTLFYQFSPGAYSVCITAETADCPQGTQFCREIVIN